MSQPPSLGDLWSRGNVAPPSDPSCTAAGTSEPEAKPPAEAEAKPPAEAPESAAPKKKAKRKAKKPKPRREELDVICRKAGPHSDLVGLPGFLVIDFNADDRPSVILFDPIDEDIENAELDVGSLMRGERHISVSDSGDSSRWQFELTTHAGLDEDEDAIEIDWEAADYDVDEDHPFNRGL